MTDNHIPSTHSNLFFSVALLHSVNIAIPEPAIPSQVPLNALFFHGIPDSYVEVPVGVNSFSAKSSMAILFYVYFEEAYQTAILIQFDGAAGGFELCLKNGVLTAILFFPPMGRDMSIVLRISIFSPTVGISLEPNTIICGE